VRLKKHLTPLGSTFVTDPAQNFAGEATRLCDVLIGQASILQDSPHRGTKRLVVRSIQCTLIERPL
jgi:hypothetical protein